MCKADAQGDGDDANDDCDDALMLIMMCNKNILFKLHSQQQ